MDLEDNLTEEVLATMGVSSEILMDEVEEVEAVEDGGVVVETGCFVEAQIMDSEDVEDKAMEDLKEVGVMVRTMVIHGALTILTSEYQI